MKNWKDLEQCDTGKLKNEAEVGLIFDWENYWALEYTELDHPKVSNMDGADPSVLPLFL